jgi:alkylation response protein AidB-like acyl-CoA dehydrogenase
MDFTLNDDQLELKQAAHTWLADRFPLDRDWEAQDDRWGELEELGWLEVAEAGLGFVEEALLLEELGYALYPGPYLAHVSGQRHAHGLTFGGDGDIPTVDPTRPVGSVEGGWTSYETPRFHAACAAEALGVAQRALDLGVEHAKTRTQFGKPIGTYQAVSHPLAQTYTDVELSRSLVYWAAWCVAEEEQAGSAGGKAASTRPEDRAASGGGGRAGLAAAAAKAFATEAAVVACERSIQVHGGIGFTWEHPLHRFYKRAIWLEGFGRRPADLRLEVAEALLA